MVATDNKYFPNEIWVMIVSWASIDTLYNLCLTSHRLCSISQPHMYRTYTNKHANGTLQPYLRTLIWNPDFAKLVREVTIVGVLYYKDLPSKKWIEWEQNADSAIEKLKDRIWIKNKPWIVTSNPKLPPHTHRHPFTDFLLTLSLAVNLESLTFAMPPSLELGEYLEEISNGGYLSLKTLKFIQVYIFEPIEFIFLRSLRLLLSTPSITTFQIRVYPSFDGREFNTGEFYFWFFPNILGKLKRQPMDNLRNRKPECMNPVDVVYKSEPL